MVNAYLKVYGISVEYHFTFHDTKIKCGLCEPEEELQRMAVQDPQQTAIRGINFPQPQLTVLFVGWHTYEHFLGEKAQIQHVVDWILTLRQLSGQEVEMLNGIKCNTGWASLPIH